MATQAPITKRERLLQSALVLFGENGIHNTSTASIAKHAGVANGTLFHHFDNKKTLIEALYISIKHDLSKYVLLTQADQALPIKQQAQCLWNLSIDWGIKNPAALVFCQQVTAENLLALPLRLAAMKQELAILENMLIAGQAQGKIANYPMDLMLEQCQSQVITSGLFFINNNALSADQLYRQSAFDMFWQAIAIHE